MNAYDEEYIKFLEDDWWFILAGIVIMPMSFGVGLMLGLLWTAI